MWKNLTCKKKDTLLGVLIINFFVLFTKNKPVYDNIIMGSVIKLIKK